MMDKETVIKLFETCQVGHKCSKDCRYLDSTSSLECVNKLNKAVLELLKEQENKEREARAFIFGTLF